jgi:hypothetical protein
MCTNLDKVHYWRHQRLVQVMQCNSTSILAIAIIRGEPLHVLAVLCSAILWSLSLCLYCRADRLTTCYCSVQVKESATVTILGSVRTVPVKYSNNGTPAHTVNTIYNCVDSTSASDTLKVTILTTSVRQAQMAAPESDAQQLCKHTTNTVTTSIDSTTASNKLAVRSTQTTSTGTTGGTRWIYTTIDTNHTITDGVDSTEASNVLLVTIITTIVKGHYRRHQ